MIQMNFRMTDVFSKQFSLFLSTKVPSGYHAAGEIQF